MAKVSKQKRQNNNTTAKTKRTRKTVPRDSPAQRSSIYRGVTRHRWTGRYEAHLWDKNCWNQSYTKKGRQVYLGAYDDEEAAAHAYDLAALKYWGHDTILNFPWSTYKEELQGMEGLSKEEYIGSLRRKSSGFSRGVSKYRGVARHHHNGRWEARIGRVFGNKYLYLGTYATQEEAATAYDIAAIEYRGLNAVTNFDLSRYVKCLSPNNQNPNMDSGRIDQELGSSHTSCSQQSSSSSETTLPSPCVTSNSNSSASSALSLLSQSLKFKEMVERTSPIDCPLSSLEFEPSCRRFPDYIQTLFECEDSSNFAEGDNSIFGDPNTFASPNFDYKFDT